MTARATLALLLTLAALAAAAAAPAGDPSAATPMTDEDVVRMFAAGSSVEAILDAIRERPGHYDLSDEMVIELRRAGIPDSVIAAMRARQPAPPVAPEADRPRRGSVRVAVRFHGARTLHVPDYADEDLKDRLSLPKDVPMRAVKDLAVYVACTTPEHAPDLWRSKTPLGRDMVATPRHRMLAFVAGDTPEGKSPKLAVPRSVDVDLDDVEPHDLVAGIAARIGDRWYTIALSKPVKVAVDKGAPSLEAHVRKGAGPFAFEVSLETVAEKKDGRGAGSGR